MLALQVGCILTTFSDSFLVQTNLNFPRLSWACWKVMGQEQGTLALPTIAFCPQAAESHAKKFQFHSRVRWHFFPLQELDISYQLLYKVM